MQEDRFRLVAAVVAQRDAVGARLPAGGLEEGVPFPPQEVLEGQPRPPLVGRHRSREKPDPERPAQAPHKRLVAVRLASPGPVVEVGCREGHAEGRGETVKRRQQGHRVRSPRYPD